MKKHTFLNSENAKVFAVMIFTMMISSCGNIAPKIDVDSLAATDFTSESLEVKTAARALSQTCPLSAEFGRCDCHLDGFRTSCSFVQSCLDAGFCVAVRTE